MRPNDAQHMIDRALNPGAAVPSPRIVEAPTVPRAPREDPHATRQRFDSYGDALAHADAEIARGHEVCVYHCPRRDCDGWHVAPWAWGMFARLRDG